MPEATVNATRLGYRLGGSGVPLVLVHGSWAEMTGWGYFPSMMEHDFTVLSYDRRGHGTSAPTDGQGSVHEDVADLAALIRHLGLAPVHLLGNSYGGIVALRFAGDRPEMVRSVIVHEPPAFAMLPSGHPDMSDFDRTLSEVEHLIGSGQNEAAARIFMEIAVAGPGGWERMPRSLRASIAAHAPTFLDEQRDPDSRCIDPTSLARSDLPLAASLGAGSPRQYATVIDAMIAAVPRMTRHVLPGVRHSPHISRPEPYADFVRAILAAT